MKYIYFLECSSDLGTCCSDHSLIPILKVASSIISLIQIIVPILLIVMAIWNCIELMMNPDDKKKLTSLKNKFLAATIVFFVPLTINIVLNTVNEGSNFGVISCLKEADAIEFGSASYSSSKDETDEKKSSILFDYTNYEKSLKPKHTGAKITGRGKGADVARYAQSWVGKVGYHIGDGSPLSEGSFSDCSNFVWRCLDHFGLLDHWVKSYKWETEGVEGTKRVYSLDEAVPGDVLCWNFGDGTGHVEIYIGNGRSVGCCGSGYEGETVEHDAGGFTSIWHITAYD